ncbi:MAG: di-heme oxidoredictase family protein [Planctomycetota bacterium]
MPQPKMGAPVHGLTAQQLARFQAGRVDFSHTFAVNEGLGPIFNQSSCGSCHNNPVGGPGSQFVTRFGFTDGKGNFDPLAALGGSLLQAQAINVACQEVIPGAANTTALRVTPSALGMGLVEAIPDAAIAAHETTPPAPGITGRVHWVTPLETPTGPLRAGRFGWKAQVATTLTFSGDASQNELGFSNRLVPFDNAPNGNAALLAAWDTVADPEDGPNPQGQHFIDRITDFQRFLAAPPQTPKSGMSGEAIFNAVGCANCHVAAYLTANDPALEPALRNKAIRPYSDFLVHDMGIAADFIEQGTVTGAELRTPSLWGVRNRDPLWHDGRVVGGTLQSRILGPTGIIFQHSAFGSEAAPSAAAFNALSAADKQKVVAFLDSLGRAEFDWTGDNVLDLADLNAFRISVGGPYTPDSPQAVFDINQDGFVGPIDLNAFALVYEADCNNNGTNDLADVLNGTAADNNHNYVPDECEFCQTNLGYAGAGALTLWMCGDQLTTANSRGTFQVSGGPPNGPLLVGIGAASNPYLITPTEYLVPLEPLVALIDYFVLDNNGRFTIAIQGGGNLPISTWIFQAATFNGTAFDLSNALSVQVGGF